MKKMFAILISIAVATVIGVTQLNAQARDCDSNSVIYCGAYSASEFSQKYHQNTTGDLPGLYAHYGINPETIGTAQSGTAYKDGRVVVGSKVVATGGRSVGRHNMPGSTSFKVGRTTFYERSNSASFAADSIPAFVFFDAHGRFIGAILKSCGNAVRATPVPVPTPPRPQPAAACVKLTVTKIDRTRARFSTQYTAVNGARVTSWFFQFGDGTKLNSSSPTTDHVYIHHGNFTSRVTLKTNIGDFTSPACTAPVSVAASPVAECKSLVAAITNRTDYKLTAVPYVSNGATVISYTFVVKDSSNNVVKNVTQSTPVLSGTLPDGTYTAQVTIKTSEGDRTGDACKTHFTISPQPIAACQSLIATITNRTHYTLTAIASVSGGATVTGYRFVIKDSAGSVVSDVSSVNASVAGDLPTAGTYTAQVTARTSLGDRTGDACKTELAIGVENCTVPGKEHLPKNSPNCYENCTVPGKENLPKDSPECMVTPPPVEELPHTGAGDGLGALVGVSAIVAGVGYYVASRRNLLTAMLNM